MEKLLLMHRFRGGGGRGTGGPDPPPPTKKSQNIGFLSNTGPDPQKNNKAQCWAIIGTPAKRHLNDVSLAGSRWPLYWYLDPLSPH